MDHRPGRKLQSFLGVDGGMTHTLAVIIGSDGTLIGWGEAGCGSIEGPGGPDAALGQIRRAIQAAFALAARGRPGGQEMVDGTLFCLAGCDRPDDPARLADWLRSGGVWPSSERAAVENDGWAALAAAFSSGPGVAVCAGSGLVTVASDGNGREVALGGTGGVFTADLAGGTAMGLLGVRAALAAGERRGAQTLLLSPVLAHYEATRASDLRELEDASIAIGLADVARIVTDAASQGDAVAMDLLQAIGHELAGYAVGALCALGLETKAVPVVLSGGTFFSASPIMIDALTLSLHRKAPLACVQLLTVAPALGAALRAAQKFSAPVSKANRERLALNLPGQLVRWPGWAGERPQASQA